MEDLKIQIDYTTILVLISLFAFFVVIFLIKVIYRHNPHGHEQYGNEIALFHSSDRYKKRVWRFNLVEDLKHLNIENKFSGRRKFKEFSSENKGKISGELEFKVIMGEFSQEAQEIVKHAANHNFGFITIISGPKVFCEDRTEIYTLLDKYESVRYFILPKRPNKHFMIFDKSHMYIEKPHRHNESRGSVGIKKSNPELIEVYDQAFNKMLKYAKPVTKEEALNQECYRD